MFLFVAVFIVLGLCLFFLQCFFLKVGLSCFLVVYYFHG